MAIDIESLETPAPLADLDRLERNIARVATYAATHKLALRPHVKTHKAPFVAERQMRAGARGLTCATPRELEVMGAVCDDLLFAYPAIGAARVQRLMALPSHVSLTVALDSLEAVEQIGAAAQAAGRTVRVYVELDVGMRRVGVATVAEASAIVDAVARHRSLEYAGITFYAGHIRERVTEQQEKLDRLNATIASLITALRPPVVSGGSTPTLYRTHELEGVTEFRPGTYVYNDRTTAQLGACDADDCALTVLATVISTSVSGQAVIDAGSKALSREPLRGVAGEGFGSVIDHPEVLVQGMSEEHGILDLSRSTWRPRVGQRVRVVPNHVCVTVQLHEVVYGVRGDSVEAEYPVAARGRLGSA